MYKINDGCPNCGRCINICPVSAIKKVKDKIVITDECINCGVCVNACPVRLIDSYDDKTSAKKSVKRE